MNISETNINFGTDGWRGIIGADFTFTNLGKLAQRIAKHVSKSSGKICIGYDNRFLSPEYARFFGAILEDRGIEVDLSDKAVTTPCVAHRTNRKKYHLGIVLSASHNPACYNGIKIKENYGGSARQAIVDSIIKNLNTTDYKGPTWKFDFKAGENNWEDDYLNEFEAILPRGNLNVASDYMHGTVYPYFERLLKRRGYGTISARKRRDPLFGGINPEPKPSTLQEFADSIEESRADMTNGQ